MTVLPDRDRRSFQVNVNSDQRVRPERQVDTRGPLNLTKRLLSRVQDAAGQCVFAEASGRDDLLAEFLPCTRRVDDASAGELLTPQSPLDVLLQAKFSKVSKKQLS